MWSMLILRRSKRTVKNNTRSDGWKTPQPYGKYAGFFDFPPPSLHQIMNPYKKIAGNHLARLYRDLPENLERHLPADRLKQPLPVSIQAASDQPNKTRQTSLVGFFAKYCRV
jgi:hypothetical protein